MNLLKNFEENVRIKSSDIVDVEVNNNCIEIDVASGDRYKVVFEPNVFSKTIDNVYERIMGWLNFGNEDLILRRKIRKKVRKHE